MSDSPRPKRLQNVLLLLIKVLLLGGAVSYVLYRVSRHEHLGTEWARLLAGLRIGQQWWLLCFLVLLTFANWACEAAKWQIAVARVEQISYGRAFRSVLAGLSLSFLIATNAGNYLGRTWYLRSPDRYQVLGAMLVVSVTQAFTTYFFGVPALIFLANQEGWLPEWLYWLLILPAWPASALVLVALYLLARRYLNLISRVPLLGMLYPYLQVIHQYQAGELLRVLAWAMLRYLIFFGQFWGMLYLFGIELPWLDQTVAIAAVYWSKSALPNFSFLSDLGIREMSSVFFFGLYDVHELTIVGVTLSLWLINLVLPVLTGLAFSWGMRPHLRR